MPFQNPTIEARLIQLIDSGEEFTIDDVTMRGELTVAGNHDPNSSQNKIGALMRRFQTRGLMVPTGGVRKSQSPHRNGNLIRVWRGAGATLR